MPLQDSRLYGRDAAWADPNVEMGRFFTGIPLWVTGLLWLLYLAVEPYIRRFWPSTLVSWSRLLANQWRDPLVGRDILFAVGLGVLMHVLATGSFLLTRRLGYAIPPDIPSLDQLLGTRYVLADVGNRVFNALLNALFAVFGMVLLKIILKREWAAVIMAIALFTFTSSRGLDDVGSRAINLTFLVMFLTIIVLTISTWACSRPSSCFSCSSSSPTPWSRTTPRAGSSRMRCLCS